MRHVGSLIAGMFIAPIAWLLIAIGQQQSAETVAKWVERGAFDSVDLLVPAAYLLGAGLLIGLIASLRISPVGPIVAGLALLATYVSLFIDPLSVMNSLPRDLAIGSLKVDLRLPIVNGTTAVLGLALLIAAFSVKRWRTWPTAVPLVPAAGEGPADAHEYPLGQGPAAPPPVARPAYSPSSTTTAFPAAATSVLPSAGGFGAAPPAPTDETQPVPRFAPPAAAPFVPAPPPVSTPPVSAPPGAFVPPGSAPPPFAAPPLPVSTPPFIPPAPPVSAPPVSAPPVSGPPVSGPPVSGPPPVPFPPAPPASAPQPVFTPPVVSAPPVASAPPAAAAEPGWLTPEDNAPATGAVAYSRGASSPPPADEPPAWPVPASPAPAPGSPDTPSGSWPVVPAPSAPADTDSAADIEAESESEATRPLHAGESASGLPSRAARGPAEEERSILAGPSFDGFAVPPARPGREEETEAFHPGSQSPAAPRPRHSAPPAGAGEPEERRGRFQPMAPQPPVEEATTVIKAPSADEATTVLPSGGPARSAEPVEDPDATTLWPYGGGDEATTRLAAPVADAEATANFGFGEQAVSPAEAAERRAAFARGEAERRATAAQSQLDRIAAERATSQATGPQPAANQPDAEQPDASATADEPQPRRDNPWAQPPRDRA
nr:hypothetical protein GCM10020063_097520 [Dactylosporangium thailandense]